MMLLVGVLLSVSCVYRAEAAADCVDTITDESKANYFLAAWVTGGSDDHGIVSSPGVYVISDTVLLAKGFTYDGNGGDWVQFLASKTDTVDNTSSPCMPFAKGAVISDSKYSLSKSGSDTDVLMQLPTGMSFADVKSVGVYSHAQSTVLASVTWPATPPAVPMSKEVGPFQGGAAGLQGTVSILTSMALKIDQFTFDPQNLTECYFTVGTSASPDGTGEKLPTEKYENPPAPITMPYSAQSIILKLPKGVCSFTWFAIWDAAGQTALGSVMFARQGKETWMIPPEVGQTFDRSGNLEPSTSELPSTTASSTDPPISSEQTTYYQPSRETPSDMPPPERSTTEKADGSGAAQSQSYGIILAAAIIIPYVYQHAAGQELDNAQP